MISVDALIFWLFVAAWAIVIGLISCIAIPRAVREAIRIVRRLIELVERSPLPLQLAKAEADMGRIDAAVSRLPELEARANRALLRLRENPLVPPSVIVAVRRIELEIAAFRRASR